MTKNTNSFLQTVEMAQEHQFDESLLNSIVVNGVLKKSKDPGKFILVASRDTANEHTIEMNIKDVVKYNELSRDDKNNPVVQVFVKPEASLIQKTHSTAKHQFSETRPFGLPDWVDWTPWDKVLEGFFEDPLDLPPVPPPTPRQEKCHNQYVESKKWLDQEYVKRYENEVNKPRRDLNEWYERVKNSIKGQRNRCLSGDQFEYNSL